MNSFQHLCFHVSPNFQLRETLSLSSIRGTNNIKHDSTFLDTFICQLKASQNLSPPFLFLILLTPTHTAPTSFFEVSHLHTTINFVREVPNYLSYVFSRLIANRLLMKNIRISSLNSNNLQLGLPRKQRDMYKVRLSILCDQQLFLLVIYVGLLVLVN